VGGNLKLSEYHAAVGLAQLERLPGIARRINELTEYYAGLLSPLADNLSSQPAPPGMLRSVFCVKLANHDAELVAAGMAQQGVQTRRWYCPPLHEHPAFADCGRIGPDGGNELPVSDALGKHILGLPFHTSLEEDHVRQVCSVLKATLNSLEHE
jgi:dTDP-4-amino-4,6-dideoxygalactose transaminase